jgi:hypothetical protein
MGLDGDDKLQMILEIVRPSPRVHAQAYENLKLWAAQGKLPPVLDGTGNPLEDYVEILGIQR